MTTEIRHAVHPSDFRSLQTNGLRESFLVSGIFQNDLIRVCYTHYDRLILGGAKPVAMPLELQSFTALKSDYFLQRREIGIINVGGTGVVSVDNTDYELNYKDALYIGRGVKEVVFQCGDNPLFYFNSAPAHTAYATKKISSNEASIAELGAAETSNLRTIRKLIVHGIVETCQLQMGLTELKPGSVWNTMPPHTHDRRMEVYFYFEIPDSQVVCHFMGEPQETRHLFVTNNQAVISPPWSIHSGAGTSNYAFIWGMAGENLDYGDMDQVSRLDLK